MFQRPSPAGSRAWFTSQALLQREGGRGREGEREGEREREREQKEKFNSRLAASAPCVERQQASNKKRVGE